MPHSNSEDARASQDPETRDSLDNNGGAESPLAVQCAVMTPIIAGKREPLYGMKDELIAIGVDTERLSRNFDTQPLTSESLYRSVLGAQNGFESWENWQSEHSALTAFQFLTSVLSSPGERESTAAAVALWNGSSSASGQDSIVEVVQAQRLLSRLGVPDELISLRLKSSGLVSNDPLEALASPVNIPAQYWQYEVSRELSHMSSYENPLTQIRSIALARIASASLSADKISQSFAYAARLQSGDPDEAAMGSFPPPLPQTGLGSVSTLVHGTRAWRGSWWEPRSVFANTVRLESRTDLYDGYRPFSWDGALRKSHRELAGERLKDWFDDPPQLSPRTVIGHSYGGEVIALAVKSGLHPVEIVLLSSPISGVVQQLVSWRRDIRVVDVRLRIDPILMFTLLPQRFRGDQPAIQIISEKMNLSHSATHTVGFWNQENIWEAIGTT